ncbi:hypothetical protein ABZS99_46495, partial [Streptomyces sp. NPDC005463]|uniref:hypothetical protein n=1 Tax=Streptomyces sp. NPDC005463 TaxID=3154465 RepID=UPI0033A03E70
MVRSSWKGEPFRPLFQEALSAPQRQLERVSVPAPPEPLRVFNCWGFGLGILMDAIYQSVRASVGYFVPL